MADAPFITGSDLTSNPGNAALGYSSGIAYNANPEIQNPFAGIQSSLSSLQNEEVYRRQLAAQQAQKEKDELAAHLAETGQSVFNMKGENGQNMSFSPLQEDYDIMRGGADEIRKSTMGNPTGWKFDLDRIAKEQRQQQLVRHAGVRAVEVAKLQQAAAATNDPQERADILNHISKIKSQKVDDFISPDPYMPKAKYDVNKFIQEDVINGKNKEAWQTFDVNSVDDKGAQKTESLSGISNNVLNWKTKAQPGSELYANAVNMANGFYNSNVARDPRALLAQNKRNAEINAFRGFKPGDSGYVQNIAEVLPNGQIQYTGLSPVETAYTLTAEAYGGPQVNRELKKTAAETTKEKLDIAGKRADIAKTYADIENARKRLEVDKDKMTKADYDNQNDILEAKTAALNVQKNLTSAGNFMGIPEIINSVPEGNRSGLSTTLANNGIDPSTYEMAILNRNDQTIKHISGVQSQKQDGTYSSGVSAPQYTYLLKPKSGNLADYRYLIGFKELQEMKNQDDGTVIINKKTNKPQMQEVMQWKTVSPQEAIGNSVKAAKNFYNITDKTGENINRAVDYFDKLSGAAEPAAPKENNSDAQPAVEGAKKMEGGKRMLFTNGVWKTVKGKDKKGNFVFE